MKKPIYRQIVEDFKSKIANGVLKPNDSIPSQTELARIYNVAEMTMRKALALMVEEDLIVRVRKKGSFIKATAKDVRLKTNSSLRDPLVEDSKFLASKEANDSTALASTSLVFTSLRKVYFVHRNVKANLLNESFYLSMLSGMEQVCSARGVSFSILDMGKSLELPYEVDSGYILFGEVRDTHAEMMKTVEQWKREERRMVTVQFYFPHLEIHSVTGDNMTGGYLATQHLLGLGHERIGIILSGKSQLEMALEFSMRFQGYRLALGNYNIPYDSDLVSMKEMVDIETEASGYEGFMELMLLAHRPTAVFAASDFKAMGAMKAARELGLRVPEDVSIIGYDGMSLGQWTEPRLTTVDQCTHLFGKRAAEMILQYEPDGVREVVISPQLVVRESTGVNGAPI